MLTNVVVVEKTVIRLFWILIAIVFFAVTYYFLMRKNFKTAHAKPLPFDDAFAKYSVSCKDEEIGKQSILKSIKEQP